MLTLLRLPSQPVSELHSSRVRFRLSLSLTLTGCMSPLSRP